MKKFHGTLLRTVAEQLEGGDSEAIDPAGLDISVMPHLSWNFDPRRPAGTIDRVWIEDGRVLIEGHLLTDDAPVAYPCAGVMIARRTGNGHIHEGRLYEVGLSSQNVDTGIGPITIEE